MEKITYNCKQNDAIIRVWTEYGVIKEVWVKIKGDNSFTIIGYDDLLNALRKANDKQAIQKST